MKVKLYCKQAAQEKFLDDLFKGYGLEYEATEGHLHSPSHQRSGVRGAQGSRRKARHHPVRGLRPLRSGSRQALGHRHPPRRLSPCKRSKLCRHVHPDVRQKGAHYPRRLPDPGFPHQPEPRTGSVRAYRGHHRRRQDRPVRSEAPAPLRVQNPELRHLSQRGTEGILRVRLPGGTARAQRYRHPARLRQPREPSPDQRRAPCAPPIS